nr:sialidase family protein [Pseudomonas sp.]
MRSQKFGSLPSRLAVVSLFAVFASAWWLNPDRHVLGFAMVERSGELIGSVQAPFYSSRFASSDLDEFVHASSVASLPDGGLMAVWFAGSREGAADVQVRGSRYDAQEAEWGEEIVLATRESTESATQKHIRKLGNPVIALAPDNRLWLFYVSVSIGGWAGSAINAMYSDDLGENWSAPKQLITTPFLNISTLVRNAPVFHRDGTIGLPVYHEFLGKFAEYLYISPAGDVVDKTRISRGKHSLQPTIVPMDEYNAVAMLRYAGDIHHKVLASRTEDAGQTWSEPYPINPANPNSSLAAVATPDHGLLVALNDLEDGRFRLRLMGTDSGLDLWKPVIDLDESPDPYGNPFSPEVYREIIGDKFLRSSGPRRESLVDEFLANLDQRVCKDHGCDFEYEYPYFIKSGDGLYHLVYSWNNTFIKHISFNDAWLEEQL